MKTETLAPPAPPALNALEICNQRIVEAKSAANAELARLRLERSNFEKTPFTPDESLSVAQTVTAQTAHTSRGHEVAYKVRNFDPSRFAACILDDDGNRPLLEDALRHLREKHAAVLKRKATSPATIAPKKSGLATLIENALGAPVEPEPTFPPPRPSVRGGPWGQDEPLDIGRELSRLQEHVTGFPLAMTFEAITGSLNAVNSQLREEEPKAAPPQRMDKPFIVPAHM